MSEKINLHNDKEIIKDELYTSYKDIEEELIHYKEHFENKIVLCNCNDPEDSNFWKYFKDNFYDFKLKKLISTSYEDSYKFEYDDENIFPLFRDNKIWAGYTFNKTMCFCSLCKNFD